MEDRKTTHVHGKKWGPWRYDARLLSLTHTARRYEVDLEQCNTSAEILDWLCQVSQRSWCSREDAGYLLAALDALLDPQAHVCSGGIEGSGFSASKYLRQQRDAE